MSVIISVQDIQELQQGIARISGILAGLGLQTSPATGISHIKVTKRAKTSKEEYKQQRINELAKELGPNFLKYI